MRRIALKMLLASPGKFLSIVLSVAFASLLVGPSGCCKTTLLTIIAGMLQSTSGEVTVLGSELSRMSIVEQTRFCSEHLGFVFQQYNLLPALSAAENVAVPLIVRGCDWDEALTRTRSGLADMDRATRSPRSCREVAIARALVHQPQLIVCDEPTAALDAKTGHLVMSLLRESALQADRAVMVVTHDPRVFPFGDRSVFMEDGRVTRLETQQVEAQAAQIIAGTTP